MRKTLGQLLKYGIVGLMSNGIGYALYLGLTYMGIGPKFAMSLLYVLGIMQTFIFNKRWSFRHEGVHGRTFIRYGVTYGIGYIINFLALLVLVDWLGYPHQIIQAELIIFIAILLFMLQKFWVFRQDGSTLHSELVKQ